MENKYYSPDIADIWLGYEMEIATMTGWVSGKFPEILKVNNQLDEFGNDDLMKLAHAIIRVSSLTKEQIEAEGWVYKGIGLIEGSPLLFGKDNLFEIVFYSPDHLVINQFGGTLQYQHRYIGCCPSINEFRKIVKWLGI